MEPSGILFKYKLNRELTGTELHEQLRQKKRLKLKKEHLVSYRTVVNMNSTYIEVVDKYYNEKGYSSMLGVPMAILILWFILAMDISFVINQMATLAADEVFAAYAAMSFVNVGSLSMLALFCWILHKTDWFTYTHWPVRLNRKTRMVHVFRHNGPGGVLSVKWDDLFICYGRGGDMLGTHWDIRCHVRDDKGIVQDTFSFGEYAQLSQALDFHWEYFRRYMEEGPDKLPPPKEYPPIAEKKESFWLSVRYARDLFGNDPISLLFLPLTMWLGLMRGISMRTCKTPQWPADVEAACAVPADEAPIPAERGNETNAPLMALCLTFGLAVDAYLLWWFIGYNGWAPHPHQVIPALFS